MFRKSPDGVEEWCVRYEPRPIDTDDVALSPEVLHLVEELAEHNHDIWALGRMAEGWTYGPARDDAAKRHPCLVAYDALSEAEKDYDRRAAMESLKAVLALGYRILPPGASAGDE